MGNKTWTWNKKLNWWSGLIEPKIATDPNILIFKLNLTMKFKVNQLQDNRDRNQGVLKILSNL